MPLAMVIENDVEAQRTAAAVLTREGFELTATASLHEARARLDDLRPQLLLSSPELPDGDGLALLAEFPPAELPTVIVLANSCHEADHWIHESVSYHCVSKPIDPGQLASAIRRSDIQLPPPLHTDSDPMLDAETAGSRLATPGDFLRVKVPSRIADMERELILATLRKFQGSKVRTASALGISLKTLYNRLQEYRSGQ